MPTTLTDTNNEVTINITDDDEGPSVSAAVTAMTMATVETDGTVTIDEGGSITLTFTLNSPPASGSVTVTTTVDSASSSSTITADDYSIGTAITLMAGSATGTIVITAADDTADEDTETMVLTHEIMRTGITDDVSGPGNTTLNITDGDTPAVTGIAVNNATITESDTDGDCAMAVTAPATNNCATVTVTLGAAVRPSGVGIRITRTDGTEAAAVEAADYTIAHGDMADITDTTFTVMVAGGAMTATFTVTADQDDDIEADGVLTFTVAEPDTGNESDYTVANNTQTMVTIDSEDVPEASITVTAPGETMPETTGTVTVPESGSDNAARTATVTVTFTPATTEAIDLPITVTLNGASGLAQALLTLNNATDAAITNTSGGALVIDSVGGSDVLTIRNVPAGGSFSFNITINDDTLNDDDEGYTIAIQGYRRFLHCSCHEQQYYHKHRR